MARPTVNDVHIDSAMTQVSIQYKNAAYIAEQVFPTVPVEKQSDYYFLYPKDDWMRDEATDHAPGTRARRIDYTVSSASYTCVRRSMAKAVTDAERANADAPLRPDVDATSIVTSKILLGLERRVASIITTCANWTSASNPSVLWSDDASDPVNDIENLKMAIMQQTGAVPNTVVIGQNVWSRLSRHPDILEKIKYTERGVLIVPTLAAIIGVPKLLVGTTIYNSAKEGATVSMSFIWGNHFWMGYVPENPSLAVPAAGYVFQWGTREVKRFREDQEEQDVMVASHWTSEKITASDAGGGWYTVL